MGSIEEVRDIDGPYLRDLADSLIEREDATPHDEASLDAAELEWANWFRLAGHLGSHLEKDASHKDGADYFEAGFKAAIFFLREVTVVQNLEQKLLESE